MNTGNNQKTEPSLKHTNTKLPEALRLVDFDNVAPSDLEQQVKQAISKANTFLDSLEKSDQEDHSISPQEALNSIIEFDHINLDLDRSWGILSHLNSVVSNDEIREVHHGLLPKLSAYSTKVGQHSALYQLYQTVKADVDFFNTLPLARQRALQLSIQGFELSGIALPTDEQHTFAEIQSELSTLSAKYSDNVLDATQAYALPLNESQLSGLTQSGLAMLASAGERHKQKTDILTNDNDNKDDTKNKDTKNKDGESPSEISSAPYPSTPYYVATLDIPVYLAIMTHADNRDLRETIYKAYVTRASEFDNHTNAKDESLDNSNIMADILRLREQKAHLLGFNNYAEVSLSRKMADSVDEVAQFLRDLAKKATPAAKQDLEELQSQAVQYGIDADDLQPWDTAYLAEKVKQQKFSLSQEEIRPYFPLPKVIDGLFTIVNRLYGTTAIDHTQDVTLWHDEVRFYQLYDENNVLIGGFYFDLYARQGKRGGAWMSGFQSRYVYSSAQTDTNRQDHYEQLPVCFMVGNFTPPNGDTPSLLTHNEVITLFHEFGHGLHHLLTTVTIGDVAGVNGVEWDAVELPSQFMENWAWDSEGIALISAHVDTGEPLPKDKLDALLAAKNFQSGMQTLRQIEFALFDLLIHAASPAPNYEGILETLESVRHDVALLQTPEYNRFANGFSHIFAGGYAAGYYSYKWAELLSADAFSRFEEEGIFNSETGKQFRESVLAVGGSTPAKANFEAFRGRMATIDALLRHSGFATPKVGA